MSDERFDRLEKTLERHGELLESLIGRVDRHDGILDEHGRTLDEHGGKLDEHGRKLDEHGRKLDEHGRKLDEHGRRLDSIDDTLTFMVKRLDQYSDESRRYMEVLTEQHRAEMRALKELLVGNRDRLEDHEVRIQALESA